ncbi:MAG: TonB family protein [Thermomonas sp.]
MAEPNPQRDPLRKSLLSPRNLKLLAIAFGVGLLLFLFLWMDQRNDTDFFKATGSGTSTGDTEALPAPLPADVASDDQNASGLTLPPAGQSPSAPASQLPHIIEPAATTASSMPPEAAPASGVPAASGDNSAPVAVSQPPPSYPREALRRGIGGTVRVQVTVSPDGSVERMELATSSGDRNLDRAAMEAVRRWRFQPAMRNGQPISATVVIPLDFTPNR